MVSGAQNQGAFLGFEVGAQHHARRQVANGDGEARPRGRAGGGAHAKVFPHCLQQRGIITAETRLQLVQRLRPAGITGLKLGEIRKDFQQPRAQRQRLALDRILRQARAIVVFVLIPHDARHPFQPGNIRQQPGGGFGNCDTICSSTLDKQMPARARRSSSGGMVTLPIGASMAASGISHALSALNFLVMLPMSSRIAWARPNDCGSIIERMSVSSLMLSLKVLLSSSFSEVTSRRQECLRFNNLQQLRHRQLRGSGCNHFFASVYAPTTDWKAVYMHPKANRLAFQVALTYVIAAVSWNFASDALLKFLVSNPRTLIFFDMIKDSGFAVLTAGLLYIALVRLLPRLEQEAAQRQRAEAAQHESEERFRQLFAVETDAVCAVPCEQRRGGHVQKRAFPQAVRLHA